MPITLYDLAGAEDARRFSPYCWRVKMALWHKGLPFEALPWRFTEKDRIAFSGQDKVPVIEDGGRVVSDSWAIALHLEEAYPERPPLFEGPPAAARFVADWTEQVVHPGIQRLVLTDIWAHLADKDKAYFRESREKRFGMTLEAYTAGRDERVGPFRAALAPLRALLGRQPFLAGRAPAFADHVVFAAFQWARCISPFPLLAADDAVAAWRRRLLETYDGAPGRALGYPC